MSVSRDDIELVLGCPHRLEVRLEAIRGIETSRPFAWEGLVRNGVGDSWELFSSAVALGLDVNLELVSLARVLEQLERARDGRLAVNLSPAVVALESVQRLLEPIVGRLIVEISELAGGPSMEVVASELAPLRRRGLRVALDNAGVGFAGLERLALLEPDVVKLDRSIVAEWRSRSARFIATLTATAAHELGARLVVVGVETPAQLSWARDLGADGWQGFAAPPAAYHTNPRGLLARLHRGVPPEPPRLAIEADSSCSLARRRFHEVGLGGPPDVANVVAGGLVLGWVSYRDLEDLKADTGWGYAW